MCNKSERISTLLNVSPREPGCGKKLGVRKIKHRKGEKEGVKKETETVPKWLYKWEMKAL